MNLCVLYDDVRHTAGTALTISSSGSERVQTTARRGRRQCPPHNASDCDRAISHDATRTRQSLTPPATAELRRTHFLTAGEKILYRSGASRGAYAEAEFQQRIFAQAQHVRDASPPPSTASRNARGRISQVHVASDRLTNGKVVTSHDA